jgi:hypothetical protein
MDRCSEGLLTEEQAHRGAVKEFTRGGRCTYFFCAVARADR